MPPHPPGSGMARPGRQSRPWPPLCLLLAAWLLTALQPSTANAAVTFSAPTTNALPGSQVLVPIRTTNFTSIGVFQFTLRWNPAVISYVSVEQFGLLGFSSGSLGLTDVGSGIMRVSWDDINGAGVSVADGTTLFAVRFQLAGSAGQQSALWFTNSPMTIEAYDGNLEPLSVTTVNGAVTITGAPTPPSFSSQPQGQTVSVGENVNFTVTATGSAPLLYQWRHNNSNLNGATSAILALTNVQTSQAGDYVCVVTNSAGAVTSSVARLTVTTVTPPSITTHPQSQAVNVGANVNFTVTATGSAPLLYQWRRNNSNLNGATSATLALSNVQTSQAGDYLCVVTNSAGSVTSSIATLTVNVPDSTAPSITITSPTSNPVFTNQQATINLGGSASDNIAVTQVTWSNNRGGTGTANGTNNWSAFGITLQPGTNLLTVTARDAANNIATDTLTVTYTPVAGTLTFAVGSTNGAGGNQLLVPVRATNFNGITLFQFTVTWNPAVLSYVGVEQFGVSGLSEGSFGTTETAAGILRVSWDDITLAGVSLPPGGIVFSVRFQLVGSPNSSTPVAITGSPMPIEATDQNFTEIPVNVLPGQVVLAGPPIPPSITTHPQSQTVTAGVNVSFSVAATGTEPFSYFWKKDGLTIGGAGATLVLSNVQLSATGDYLCIVSNNAGAVTSSVARLTVNPPPQAPTITTHPDSQTVLVGANVSFTVVATGTAPLGYLWRKDGATLTGANSPTLPLSNVQLSQTGDYVCIVSNTVGSVTSLVARLTVNPPPQAPSITTHPQGQTVFVGTNVNLTVVATGTAPLGYYWRKDGAPLGAPNAPTLALANVQTSHSGDYVCVVSNAVGSITSAVARLTVNLPPQPPSITSQPQGQSVIVGGAATFTVTATGTAPLAYQWRRENVNVNGATSATLSLTNIQSGQAGDYVCVVTNVAGAVTSSVARLTVTAAPQAPSITAHPQSQTVTAGTNVTFAVLAAGTAPLSYQWRRDNVNIGGATSFSLALSNVQVSQTGDYLCVITNSAGAITSAVARLTVNPPPQPPSITVQPVSRTVTAGTNVSFSVVAAGTEPLVYAWRKDGTNLPGATFATLTLVGVQVGQTGDYACLVTNVAGAVTSSVARLTVNPAPQAPVITTQPLAQTVTAGDDVSLLVVATGTAPLSYQWRRDGTNVPGGNAAALTLPDIQISQAGDYICVVTNIAGVATSASARITVNPPPDTIAPTITITSPTSNPTLSVTNNTIALGGTASDAVGVTQVLWSNSRNGSGAATGTNAWTIPAITLQPGTNIITVTARDAANNVGTDLINVVYTPPVPGALTITLGTTNGFSGSQVLVPVRVSGFTRINLFQFSMHWDPSVVTYQAVEQLGLAGLTSGNFGTSQAASGQLVVSWDDPDTTFKTLPDGSILFSVRFQLTGAPGANTRVYIDDSPTGILEAANADLLNVPVVVSEGRVSINSVNAAPVLANIGNKSVGETTTLTFTALASDSDIPAQSLTFSLDAGAPAGANIDPQTGVFTWTPTEVQGPATNIVTIRVTDNGSPAQSDFETITISVAELNASPVLNAIGSKSLNEGQLLAFTALGSDMDLPPQSLTFSLDAGAPSGAIINPASGAFTWTPSEAQGPALVTITVRVTDNGSPPQSDFETISVTVGEINAAPVLATIGNKTATENIPLTFTATATDPDLPAQTLTYSLTAAPPGATIDASTGLFSWTPSEAQGPSTNMITVRVVDSGAPTLADTETFAIVVLEGNSSPTLAPIGDKIVNEIGLLTFTASGTDTDVPVQTLTYTLDEGAPQAAALHPLTGVFTWQHTEADGPSTNLVTVRVTDNGTPPASASETIAIVINEVNAAPVLSTIANKAGREGELCQFTATTTDSDIPVQTLAYTLEGAPTGAIIDPATGVFSWTPSDEQGPSTNTFTIRVTDNGSPPLSDSETIIITVGGVNTPPILDPLSNRSVTEDQLLTFTADAEDDDSPAQTLFYTLDAGAPAGAAIHPGTGVFTWTPSESQGPGSYLITVRVTDSGSPPMSDARTITVQVLEANSAPVLGAIENKTVGEGNLLTFTASATDSDQPAQPLTYSLDFPPAGASLNPNTGVFSWTPSEAQGPSTNTLTIRVTDNGSPPFSDFKTFTIVVTEVNNPPVFGTITDKTVAEGASLNFTATATDPDFPAQTLTWSLVNSQPPGCCVGASLNPTTGLFTWNTTEAQGPSTNTFTVRVLDNGSPARDHTATFTVIVSEVNAAPTLGAIGNKVVQEGALLQFTVTATDVDIPSQVLTFSFGAAAPAGAALDPVTGVFTWTPTEAQGPSTNSLAIRVTDNGDPNRSHSETISIVVTEVNTAPTLAAIGGKAIRAGDLLTFTASATDADLPAQTLHYSLDPGAPSGAGIDAATGAFTWRPTLQQAPSTNMITVRVTDNAVPALQDFETIAVIVTDANEAPVLGAIGNKTVAEGSLLTFTATATDADVPAQRFTFTLDAGAPSGAALNPTNGVFTWIPAEAQGPSTNLVTIRVTDSGTPPLSDSETIAIVVNEVESPPAFDPITPKTAVEGTLLSFTATAVDPDSPPRALTYSLVSVQPPGCCAGASLDPGTGLFTWTPNEAQGSTTNSITIRVTEAGPGGASDTETFTVVVLEHNEAPELALIGSKAVAEGSTLSFSVVASDVDSPAQSLTFSLDPGAPPGAAIHQATGLFTWTPAEAQGPATNIITIRVTDSGNPPASGFQAISVVVSEVNLPPVLGLIGNKSVAKTNLLSFTAIAADPDLPAQSLTFSLGPGAPAGASLHPDTGLFTWTPSALQGPSTNTVTILVTDNPPGGGAMTDSETFLITVTEGNSPPTVTPVPDQTVAEGTLLTFTVTATDSDVPPATLTYSLQGAPVGASINQGSGVFSWTPSEAQGPATNVFIVRATEVASGLSGTATIRIVVTEVNSPPMTTAVPNKTVAENSLLSFTVTASDPDQPIQALTYSLEPGSPAGASIHPTSGLFTWTPSESQGPSTNLVNVVVSDGQLQDVETVRIVVTEVNFPPLLAPIADVTVPEGTLLTFTAAADDADLPPQALTFSLGSAPSGAALDPTSGVFTWTPAEAQGPSTNTITVRVRDNATPPASNSVTFVVTVLETNNAPVLSPIGDKTIAEGALLTFTARATDTDFPSQQVTFALDEGSPLGAVINPSTGVFSWAPEEWQGPSTNLITIRAADNASPPASSAETIRVVVNEVNRVPSFPNISARTIAEGNTLTFTAEATDPDFPEQTLTYLLAGNVPPGAAIDSVNGVFSWTPSEGQGPSTNTLTLRAVDGGVPPMSNTVAVTIIVTEVNTAPTLNPIGNKSVNEGATLAFTVTATDADLPAQTLTFSLDSGAPAGAVINGSTGLFAWTPSELQGSTTNLVTIRVTDNSNPSLSASETIQIVVLELNTAPAISAIPNKTIAEGALLSFSVTATDSDVPSQSLMFSLDPAAPVGIALDPFTGLFSWTPAEAQGPATNFIPVLVTDNGQPALTSTQIVRVVVTEVNSSPVLATVPDQTIPEGVPFTFTATASDADLPLQALTFSLAAGAPPGASINASSGVFTWTPSEAQGPSVNTITLRVTDAGAPAITDSVSFTLTVFETNNAPVLQPIGGRTVAEGATVTFTARATDSDLPAQDMVFSLDEGAPVGASINPVTGVFSWTPDEFQGPSTNLITVRVTDNATASASETISIVVTEVNRPPVLPPIITNRVVLEGILLTFTAEASDTDSPEQTLTYLLAGNVPLGAAIDASGVFSWTPTEAQGPSTNTFALRVIDSGSPPLSNSVTITVVVNEVNLAPILQPIPAINAPEGMPVTFTAMASDADLPSQRLRFNLEGVAPLGASINQSNGVFTWTPSETQAPSTNFITVRVADNGSPLLSAQQTVTITVFEVNSAPVMTPVPNKTVPEGSPLAFTLSATDSDVPVQGMFFSLAPGAPAGAALDPVTGLFTWTPSEAQGPGTNMVTVNVIDDGAPPLVGVGTIQIVVTEVNSPPSLAPIPPQTVAEGTLLGFSAVASDDDLPPQSFTYSLVAPPAGASINPVSGVFSWTPAEAQGPGTNTISIRVTDSGSPPLSATQTVLVTVLETNNAPILQAIGNKTVPENVLLTFTARAADSDLPAQTLTYSLDEGAPVGAVINGVTGAFSWTPDEWQGPATNVVVVRVTDNGSPPRSSFETIQIVVNEVNRAPVLPLLTNRTILEGLLLSFSAEAADVDVPEQALAYSLVGNVPDGAFMDPVNGVFSWTPTEAQGPSTNTFTVRVVDDGTPRLSNSVTLTFVVSEANLPPTLEPMADRTISEGSLLTFNASAADPDLPAQRLRFTLEGKVPLGLTINPNTGALAWTPTEAQGPSTNVVSVRVSDNGVPVLDAVQSLTIVVTEANVPPVLAPIANKTVPEGSLLTFTATASDTDLPAQTLRFSLDPGAPVGANIDAATGVFSWVPGEEYGPGTNTITVRVTEEGIASPLSAARSFTVIVNEANNPPAISTIQDKTVPEGVLLTFAVSATDSDTPPQSLTYALTTAPAGAAIDPLTGVFSFVATEEQGPGTNTVTIRVTDNGSKPASSTATFRILVTEANAAPVLTPVTPQVVPEGSLLTFTVLASDPDVPAQRLTFSIAGAQPSGCCGDAVIDPATGVFAWTPSEPLGPGTNIITVRVTDNGSPSQSATVPITIVVNEFNTPPILATIGNKAARRGDTLRFTASAVDTDLPAQTLTFSLDPGAPAGASINPSTGQFSWEPTSAQSPGTNIVTIRVTDNSSPQLSDFETFLIVVDGSNTAPVLESIDDETIPEGSLFTFTADASDEDAGQILTFTVAGPAGANIDPQTGVFTWTPSEEQGPGTYPVTIAVTDNGQPPITDVDTFIVEVTEVNTAPEIAPIADRIACKGITLTVNVVATDVDIPVQTLTYSLDSDPPSGAMIDPETGLFTWTPSDEQSPSTNVITVKVRDNGSSSRSATRSFTVVVSEEPGNLKLEMLASPDAVGRGEIVTFTMVVSNQGPGVAVGVVVTNLLPSNATFVSADPEPALAVDSLLAFNVDILPPGASTNISVAVKATAAGTVVNSAEVGSVSPEIDLQDNAATASVAVGADPALSVSDAAITEVNRNSSMARFEITLSASSRKAIQVEYFTVRNTALQLKDFKTTRGIIKFPPGATRRVIKIPIIGDTLPENDETFYVRLRKPRYARIRRGQGICTIRNNDADPNISISDARVKEGNTVFSNAVFTVRLSKASGRTVTVNFSTSDRTALGGMDYAATNGVITFSPGSTSRTLRIPIYPERIAETNETFVVNLQDAVNGNIIDSEGVATILNDDPGVLAAAALPEEAPASPAPQEAALPLRISSAAIFDNDIQITFPTLPGRTYVVEHTDDVGKPTWQPAGQPVLGTGNMATVTDPGGAAHAIRFYRVRIVE